MIILTADENKIYASCVNENFASGEKVYLPDNADVTQWQQFNSVEEAKIALTNYENLTNAEMLTALGVQPNEEVGDL